MRPHIFSDSVSIVVLSFTAEFENACTLSRDSESAAVRCFQLYVEEHAKSLLLIRLTGSSVAVDFEQSEMLCLYEDLVNLFLQTFVAD